MHISFRYNDNDYLELLKFKNSDYNNTKTGRLFFKLFIPTLIILLLSITLPLIFPYITLTLLISVIFIIYWIIFSDKIYYGNRDRSLKYIAKTSSSNNIQSFKDTKITLDDEFLLYEIEGMYSKISWDFVDKVYLTDTNIFISLNSNFVINIPIRVFGNNSEKDIFIECIDNHLNKDYGLKVDNPNIYSLNNYLNDIGEFLAARDIDCLSKEALKNKYDIEKVDILILLGNAIPYTIAVAYDAYKKGLCDKILISGGIGHSTELLRNAIKTNFKYNNIETANRSEGDIFKDILVNYFNVPEDDILLENQSTNCGDNALKSIKLLDSLNIKYNSILLIQDPTMQLRSYASFSKYLENRNVNIINYAPFIPKLDDNMNFSNEDIDGIWDINRYLNLISGEVPRLRDDTKGYGPNGKNFIAHIDIPNDILKKYDELINIITNRR